MGSPLLLLSADPTPGNTHSSWSTNHLYRVFMWKISMAKASWQTTVPTGWVKSLSWGKEGFKTPHAGECKSLPPFMVLALLVVLIAIYNHSLEWNESLEVLPHGSLTPGFLMGSFLAVVSLTSSACWSDPEPAAILACDHGVKGKCSRCQFALGAISLGFWVMLYSPKGLFLYLLYHFPLY